MTETTKPVNPWDAALSGRHTPWPRRRSVGRVAGWVVVLATLGTVGSCATGDGNDAGAVPTPSPSATPTACVPYLDPAASQRVREALVAVQLALADGLTLTDSVEAVFNVSISAMTTPDRADTLRVLAGLDSCPRQSTDVRDTVPTLIHRLAEESARLPR